MVRARSASVLRGGLAVGRLLGRGLRALAAVERVVERQAVVALRDGRRCDRFERIHGRRELDAGVPIRAGGARGIDRALGLLHLSVGRLRARDSTEQR